jgi:hypothetical protein
MSTKPVAPSTSPLTGLAAAIDLWKKYKHLPLGAAVGSAVAFGMLLINPGLMPDGWSRGWIIAAFGIGGVALERLLHWIFGRWIDPLLAHWGAKWTARLELDRLKVFQGRGMIDEVEAGRIKKRIAKRAVAGGPRPVTNRPATYRKRRPPAPPPAPPAAPSGPADSSSPAA